MGLWKVTERVFYGDYGDWPWSLTARAGSARGATAALKAAGKEKLGKVLDWKEHGGNW